MAHKPSSAANKTDTLEHALSEIVIPRPLTLQNAMRAHVIRHRFGLDCRIRPRI